MCQNLNRTQSPYSILHALKNSVTAIVFLAPRCFSFYFPHCIRTASIWNISLSIICIWTEKYLNKLKNNSRVAIFNQMQNIVEQLLIKNTWLLPKKMLTETPELIFFYATVMIRTLDKNSPNRNMHRSLHNLPTL